MLTIRVPGEPCAQGRPRAAVVNGRARVFDPKKSRNWKATAREHMCAAIERPPGAPSYGRYPFPSGPVRVSILARFTCPKGDHRKTVPAPERWRDKKPDAENVAKAVLDAATGVLWQDDAQVADLRVLTVTAAQGMAPEVVLEVEALPSNTYNLPPLGDMEAAPAAGGETDG